MKIISAFIVSLCLSSYAFAENEARHCGELTFEETVFHNSQKPHVFVLTTEYGCRYEMGTEEALAPKAAQTLRNKIAKALKTGKPATACIKGWVAGGPACGQGWAAYFSYVESVR